jgi:hypothetical protein
MVIKKHMIILLINMGTEGNNVLDTTNAKIVESNEAVKTASATRDAAHNTIAASFESILKAKKEHEKGEEDTTEDFIKTTQDTIIALTKKANELKSSVNEEEGDMASSSEEPDCSLLQNQVTNQAKLHQQQHTAAIEDHVKTYLNNKFNSVVSDLKSTRNQVMLLNDVMDSKYLLKKGFEKDLNLKKTLNSKNKNYIITMQRLSQFYSRNINSQTSVNNILKIVLIVLSIGVIFILKTDIKDILKGTLSNKSIFIKPLLPAILSIVGLIVYLVYLFNNKNIHEISPIILLSIIIFIIYIQYITIKLKSIQSPIIPVLYGIAWLPYIILFIIEKLDLNHNIIPIHDKNTNLSFKINDDITNLKRDNDNLNVILSKYKEYQEDYIGDDTDIS